MGTSDVRGLLCSTLVYVTLHIEGVLGLQVWALCSYAGGQPSKGNGNSFMLLMSM